MTRTRVRPLERKVLRDTVYESLLDMLMAGYLAPGEPLSIDGLATDLEVSPTPVREALVDLERTGLIARAPLRGYRVAPSMTPEQIDELFDARLIAELGALGLALDEDQDSLSTQLTEAHAEHTRAAAAVADLTPSPRRMAEFRAYLEAEWAFHRAVFLVSKNSYLISVADRLPAHLHRFRQSATSRYCHPTSDLAEHDEILAAVRESDRAPALDAMARHITAVHDRAMTDTARAS